MIKFYSRGEKIFGMVNVVLIGIFAFMTLYPFIYVFSSSISSGVAVATGKVVFFPREINFETYKHILADKALWIAYLNTFFYTIVGTTTSMIISICGAYALSKKRLMGRKLFNLLIAFTMWFHAGMVPFYLNLRDYGLLNSRWGIIIAFACTAFNIILLRNYFESVPVSFEESAKIDGANEFQILKNIYIPLSKPALTTIALFYAVSRWNGYFWSMILLTDDSKIPLQVYLRKKIIELDLGDDVMDVAISSSGASQETFIYSIIVVAIIPMIIIYPAIQKYFNKGLLVGGVKE